MNGENLSELDEGGLGTPALYQLSSPNGLDALIRALAQCGHTVIGPTVHNQTITLGKLESSQDLPLGLREEQEKGRYRLAKTGSNSFFGHNLGPMSWKSYLFPERRRLWQLKKDEQPEEAPRASGSFALFGVRACDLAAISVQDRIFMRQNGDPEYRQRRNNCFIVGVHCQTAAPTCFCPSMGTGPEFSSKIWDLLLTEVEGHFLVEAGSEKGSQVLSMLPLSCIMDQQSARAQISSQLSETRSAIKRQMDQEGIKELIYGSLSSAHWDEIATRCLACANCTLVCPTCFCSTVEDTSDVDGLNAERWLKWDSCFHIDFSYVHGGSRRVSTASRYRQWFSHKLASWYEQFGSSGCVGCGRCITWCPVGIDITEEVQAFRKEALLKKRASDGG